MAQILKNRNEVAAIRFYSWAGYFGSEAAMKYLYDYYGRQELFLLQDKWLKIASDSGKNWARKILADKLLANSKYYDAWLLLRNLNDGYVGARVGSRMQDWYVGAIVDAGWNKDCMVIAIPPTGRKRYWLYTKHGVPKTHIPYHGTRTGHQ